MTHDFLFAWFTFLDDNIWSNLIWLTDPGWLRSDPGHPTAEIWWGASFEYLFWKPSWSTFDRFWQSWSKWAVFFGITARSVPFWSSLARTAPKSSKNTRFPWISALRSYQILANPNKTLGKYLGNVMFCMFWQVWPKSSEAVRAESNPRALNTFLSSIFKSCKSCSELDSVKSYDLERSEVQFWQLFLSCFSAFERQASQSSRK